MLFLSLLAAAADSWQPNCSSRAETSIWFVMTAAAPSPTHDYDCKGLFFGDLACTNTVDIGRITPQGLDSRGYPLFNLRYLPYGEISSIISFLQTPDQGVLLKPPVVGGATPASTPPPPDPQELLRLHIQERQKSSNATNNVTVHIWNCPDAPFSPPTDVLTPLGMQVVQHVARAPLLNP